MKVTRIINARHDVNTTDCYTTLILSILSIVDRNVVTYKNIL